MVGYEFLGTVDITGKIRVATGMHIGGPDTGKEIGGIDAKVVVTPDGIPYIPGSSLRGKMRSLLEWELEWEHSLVDEGGKPHNCSDSKCPISRVFGSADKNWKGGPTRLLVRDAIPTEETKRRWFEHQAELKTENFINRITSRAMPRTFERVPRGSEFELDMVCFLFQLKGENDVKDIGLLELIPLGLSLVESSYVGRAGSRGYGKVKFEEVEAVVRSRSDFREGREGKKIDYGRLVEEVREYLTK